MPFDVRTSSALKLGAGWSLSSWSWPRPQPAIDSAHSNAAMVRPSHRTRRGGPQEFPDMCKAPGWREGSTVTLRMNKTGPHVRWRGGARIDFSQVGAQCRARFGAVIRRRHRPARARCLRRGGGQAARRAADPDRQCHRLAGATPWASSVSARRWRRRYITPPAGAFAISRSRSTNCRKTGAVDRRTNYSWIILDPASL